ncbi:MAG: MCE family protein, partial [Planctomycetaceae bacterium]|nr:MCE family protein [Planctomycetaceae bacterium]
AEEILTDVRGFTRPLGERGPQLIESIDRAATRMDTVLGELDTFTRSINSADGTVGRLIKDPALYESLNSVAANVNELTRELKPIVRDARAFSDKISRHPESLGVRGALFPSSGIK